MAARAVYYGLSADGALRALTINPAATLGLEGRIGSLEVGKDADVVLWDRMPLRLGASTRAVYIDGAEVCAFAPRAACNTRFPFPPACACRARCRSGAKQNAQVHAADLPVPQLPPHVPLAERVAGFRLAGPCDPTGGVFESASYAVTGARVPIDGGTPVAASIVVADGKITCVGPCVAEVSAAAQRFDASGGGEVMAGMIRCAAQPRMMHRAPPLATLPCVF